MASSILKITCLSLVVGILAAVNGCTIGATPAPKEGPMEIGHYPAPPPNLLRPRVAVAPFQVTFADGFAKDIDLADGAADEMMKLLDSSGRFNLIERVRLGQMLKEENLQDSLVPGEWTKAAPLPGINYIVIGRVLSLTAKAVDPAAEFGTAKMKQWVGMGSDKNHRVNVTVTCNLDIRLVEPSTGLPRVDLPKAYNKSSPAAMMGLDLGDKDLAPNAVLTLNRDEAQKVLRVVLDDALRQMLPPIDAMLQQPTTGGGPPPAVNPLSPGSGKPVPKPGPGAVGTVAPATTPAAARRICPECGANVSIFDEFCPNCGAHLPRLEKMSGSTPVK